MMNTLDFLLECSGDSDYGHVKWSKWRKQYNVDRPEFLNADLRGIELLKYDLSNANFRGANLKGAKLIHCEFIGANLEDVNFEKANCSFSNFSDANLTNANFTSADLINNTMTQSICINAKFINASIVQNLAGSSDFSYSDFTGSKIVMTNFVDCNLQNTTFIDCFLNGSNLTKTNLTNSTIKNATIYAVSAWDIISDGSVQENLIITNNNHDAILTVDDLEIANFIYLITNNNKISQAIDTIATKVVLILGRFTPERLETLKYIKSILKKKNLVPVLFDFEKPKTKDLTETIGLLGRMAKFVVADLTDAKSIPQELSELIPNNPSLIIYPILSSNDREFSMFEHWKKYPWVKDVFTYENAKDLDNHFH